MQKHHAEIDSLWGRGGRLAGKVGPDRRARRRLPVPAVRAALAHLVAARLVHQRPARADLAFGRIVVSEVEVPNLSENLV
jgi:hypothetical protein